MISTPRAFAAALWMAGSISGFSLVAIAGRALSSDLDTFEIMCWRSIVGVIAVTTIAGASGNLAALRPSHMGLHALRNVVHFAGQNLWLYALTLIPLSQLFALEFSYPILVALAAPVVLGERLTKTRVLSALVGFFGVLLVAQPFSGDMSPGLLAALLCALGFAGSALVTKRLTQLTSITAILFWLTAMQTVLGLIGGLWDGHLALPATTHLPWVLAIGLGGLGAHYSLTKALSLAPATVVIPIDFLRLPVISLIGMHYYGEPLDLAVLLGGAVIFSANWLNVWSESRPKANVDPQT